MLQRPKRIHISKQKANTNPARNVWQMCCHFFFQVDRGEYEFYSLISYGSFGNRCLHIVHIFLKVAFFLFTCDVRFLHFMSSCLLAWDRLVIQLFLLVCHKCPNCYITVLYYSLTSKSQSCDHKNLLDFLRYGAPLAHPTSSYTMKQTAYQVGSLFRRQELHFSF